MEEKVVQERIEAQDLSLKEVVLNLLKWTKFIGSKKLVILSFCIIGGLAGFLYAYLKDPAYTASTTFVLEESDKGSGMGQYAGLASMVGLDLGGGGSGIFQGDNIIELYKSRAMIQKTLLTKVKYESNNAPLLIDKYILINELRKKWADNLLLSKIEFTSDSSKKGQSEISLSRLQDSVLGTVVDDINKKYLTVEKPDKKLSIIRVEVKAKDELFAKEFNEEIVKNVNDFYIQTKTKKALANVNIMQHKTDSVRSVMNGAIYSAAAVSDATPNLNLTHQVQRSGPVQKYQYNAETNKGILTELVKNLELSKMSLLKETPLVQIIDKPILPLEKVHLSKVKTAIISILLFGLLTVIFLVVKESLTKMLND
ncbi:Wzz/FepE/Etk N-terminal domain-containing protein [Pedobacter sp. L105]|uniref:Wzz/FepE/Etk N-terminal domain-containing protein n=1 Tax=Pedobacter sp. L105 TaxID=1641871 RepID=UPI00131C1362|nr:Wzz/FepE/Etk N-terminal domain-containing protein [Pedobacter sp. L105]